MLTACQRDARLRSGRFEVLSCTPTADGRWTAVLADSVLYPEGGGQPYDLGTVGGVRVLAVHKGDKGDGGVVHELEGPVDPGPADVEVDWTRRFDHMQQHTGQHLLSAIALDGFGWATTSFHLHPGVGAVCDVELDAPDIGPEALADLQERINAEIRAARAVRVVLADADALPDGVRSRGLPEGLTGPVRLVEIEGVDVNTCGGTHLASTAEIQAIALLGTERVRGGTRVSFVGGQRVIEQLRRADRALSEAGALMSRGSAEVVDGVRRLLDDAKAASRSRDLLAEELADALGAALAATDAPVRVLHRASGDTAFLNRVATEVLNRAPGAVLCLTADPDAFLLVAPAERLAAVKAEVLGLLGGKGGGPPGRLQGKAGTLARRDEVARLLGA